MPFGIPYSPSMEEMQNSLIDRILESARDAIIVVYRHGRIESCNPSAALTFGLEADELIGRNIEDFIPNYADLHTNLLNTPYPYETLAIRSSGLDFPIEISATPLKSNELTSLIIRDISEKKISSNCYLQKTSEFQSLFEVLHACFLRLDPNEIILDYHIGQITDFCSSSPPLLGGRLSDFFPDDIANTFRVAFDNVKETGQSQSFEYTLSNQVQRSVFLVTIKPFLQEQLVAIIQDVTDYRNAKKSALNYHALADILPIGVFRCDTKGNYVYQNEHWLELTDNHNQHYTSWLEQIHPEDRQRISATWQQVVQEEVVFNAEFRFNNPSTGEEVYVRCNAVPELTSQGHLRGYIGIAHNITQNILANSEIHKNWQDLEAKIEERTADLRAKNRWLQQTITERKQIENMLCEERNFISTVIDTTAAIIMVCDIDGRIVRLNQSIIALTGYTERELRTRYFYEYLVPSDEVDLALERFNDLKQNKQRLDYESQCKTKYGGNKLVSWSNTTINNDKQGIEYVVFTGIDITEQRQAEEEARQHQADLIHVSRLCTMGEMAAGLAHEINQPLAAIMNYTQGCIHLLNQADGDKTELTHALRQASAQAERAAEIIRKLRELVNKSEPQQSPIKLDNVVRNAIKFASADIKKHGATVRLRFMDQLPVVYADAIQIEQVLLNLIRNGIEAMANTPLENKELLVRLFINKNNCLQASISDQGEGLPPNLSADKVFDAFFTTKSTGMGMGLAISRSIIEAHGGQMWATHNIDAGSTFHFTLPIKTAR